MTSAAPMATGSSAEEAAKAAYLAKMADGPFYSKKTGPATAPSAPAMTSAPSMTSAAPMAIGSSAEDAAKAAYLAKMADGPFYSKPSGSAPAPSMPSMSAAPAAPAAPSISAAAPMATGSSAEDAAKAAYLAKMADGPFYSKPSGRTA